MFDMAAVAGFSHRKSRVEEAGAGLHSMSGSRVHCSCRSIELVEGNVVAGACVWFKGLLLRNRCVVVVVDSC